MDKGDRVDGSRCEAEKPIGRPLEQEHAVVI